MREEEEVDEDPEGARTRRRSSPRDSCELETILRSLERGRPVPQLPPLVMYLYDKCCLHDDSERKRRRRRRGSGASRSTSQPPLASNGGGSGGRPGERESDPQDWDDDASEGEDMDVDEDFDPSSFEW